MRQSFFLAAVFFALSAHAQNGLETVFEQSGGKSTPTYAEGIAYFEQLALRYKGVRLDTMGLTDSGHPLHLATISVSGIFDFEKAHQKGKVVILINNGIHPGEPDGIDACQLLARDLLEAKDKRRMMQDIVLAIIPFYNIGGALNRNDGSRANQSGPHAYGFRGNAQNLDLNRDFVKADSRNARAFARLFQLVKPDIFIDTHVSNGADYQYRITHLATQHNKLGGALGRYLATKMTPQLEKQMAAMGEPVSPFVNVYNRDPSVGFRQFMDTPRYSTGYTALFYTLGYMIETHMLKPFEDRVLATYRFLQSILAIAQADGKHIKELRAHALAQGHRVGDHLPIRWEVDTAQYRTLAFRGYKALQRTSKVTGRDRLYFDHSQPYEKPVRYYNVYKTADSVAVPVAYVIPQGWHKVIERLQDHGIAMQRLGSDTTLRVGGYRIVKTKTAPNPYEGHFPHTTVRVAADTTLVAFRKGDYLAHTDQPSGRYLVQTLTPQATDSYFSWNFFDSILQQKEHFSSYVFEEKASEILRDDPALKAAFEAKRRSDAAFAASGYAQLDYIYKRSKHYEAAHRRYPIYTLVP